MLRSRGLIQEVTSPELEVAASTDSLLVSAAAQQGAQRMQRNPAFSSQCTLCASSAQPETPKTFEQSDAASSRPRRSWRPGKMDVLHPLGACSPVLAASS